MAHHHARADVRRPAAGHRRIGLALPGGTDGSGDGCHNPTGEPGPGLPDHQCVRGDRRGHPDEPGPPQRIEEQLPPDPHAAGQHSPALRAAARTSQRRTPAGPVRQPRDHPPDPAVRSQAARQHHRPWPQVHRELHRGHDDLRHGAALGLRRGLRDHRPGPDSRRTAHPQRRRLPPGQRLVEPRPRPGRPTIAARRSHPRIRHRRLRPRRPGRRRGELRRLAAHPGPSRDDAGLGPRAGPCTSTPPCRTRPVGSTTCSTPAPCASPSAAWSSRSRSPRPSCAAVKPSTARTSRSATPPARWNAPTRNRPKRT